MLARKAALAFATVAALAVAGVTSETAVAQSMDAETASLTGAAATVLVHNWNSHDVEVYAEQDDGRQIKLGVVLTMTDRTFTLPDWLSDGKTEFRLRMMCMLPEDPRSALIQYHEAVRTQPMSSSTGNEIVVDLADPLSESTISDGSSEKP